MSDRKLSRKSWASRRGRYAPAQKKKLLRLAERIGVEKAAAQSGVSLWVLPLASRCPGGPERLSRTAPWATSKPLSPGGMHEGARGLAQQSASAQADPLPTPAWGC